MVGALALEVALASASQDIAIDAYAVDVLRPEEMGPAVGARTALYRAGLVISGGAAITGASKRSPEASPATHRIRGPPLTRRHAPNAGRAR